MYLYEIRSAAAELSPDELRRAGHAPPVPAHGTWRRDIEYLLAIAGYRIAGPAGAFQCPKELCGIDK